MECLLTFSNIIIKKLNDTDIYKRPVHCSDAKRETLYVKEENKWEKSNINFDQNTLNLNFRGKFKFRRGRINCSLNDDGVWRWFGVQFSVKQN